MLKKTPAEGPGLVAETSNYGDSPSPSRAIKQYIESQAVIDLLCQQWPQTFFKYQARRKPLKLNIDHDIFLLLDGVVTYLELKRALACYVNNFGYLKSYRAGAPRIGLDGLSCGLVTEGEAEYARQKITARNNGSGRAHS
jgi:ProP effector